VSYGYWHCYICNVLGASGQMSGPGVQYVDDFESAAWGGGNTEGEAQQ
jgi:hypothetical protein